MPFNLTVIIPAYNVECFIEKAIQSVLEQAEVSEIIVVDDGSTDTTTQIIKELKLKNPTIKLLQHPNKVNKGRSASRNLAIQNATGTYIAFLDADDYFLSNRFTNDFKVFQENESCQGVYNAVGFHFYRGATELELQTHKLYTVKKQLNPEELFENLLYGRCGHFHINGLTVKKSVFQVTGLFNEKLIVAEDTELFWKMAIKCHLITGIIDKAVAVRGVHEKNVFNDKKLYEIYIIKMYQTLLVWCASNQVVFKTKDELLKRIWIIKQKENNKLYKDIIYWGKLFLSRPNLLFSILSIKYFPIIRYRQMLFPFLYT